MARNGHYLDKDGLNVFWGKIKSLVTDSINALDKSGSSTTGKFLSTVSQTNGVITVTKKGMDNISEATGDLTDDTLLVTSHATTPSTDTAFYKRKASKLWDYINSKLSTILAGKQDAIVAGDGLYFDMNTLHHSNAVTPRTSYLGSEYEIPKLKIDGQGHITGYTTAEYGLKCRAGSCYTGETGTTKFCRLATVSVPAGYSHAAGYIDLFAGGVTAGSYYYLKVYYNIRNNVASGSSSPSFIKKDFALVYGYSTISTYKPNASDFSIGYKNGSNGALDLIFYFRTLGSYNQLRYIFYIGQTIVSPATDSYSTSRDSGYTYITCSETQAAQMLSNSYKTVCDQNGNVINTTYVTQQGMQTYVGDAIESLVATDTPETGKIVTAVSEEDGVVSSTKDGVYAFGEATSDPVDNTYIVTSAQNPSSSANLFYRRKASYLWNYVKSKIQSVLGIGVGTHNILILKGQTATNEVTGTAGTGGYVLFAEIKCKTSSSTYVDAPVRMQIVGRRKIGYVVVCPSSGSTATLSSDTKVYWFCESGDTQSVAIRYTITSGILKLYWLKVEKYDSMSVMPCDTSSYGWLKLGITFKNTMYSGTASSLTAAESLTNIGDFARFVTTNNFNTLVSNYLSSYYFNRTLTIEGSDDGHLVPIQVVGNSRWRIIVLDQLYDTIVVRGSNNIEYLGSIPLEVAAIRPADGLTIPNGHRITLVGHYQPGERQGFQSMNSAWLNPIMQDNVGWFSRYLYHLRAGYSGTGDSYGYDGELSYDAYEAYETFVYYEGTWYSKGF